MAIMESRLLATDGEITPVLGAETIALAKKCLSEFNRRRDECHIADCANSAVIIINDPKTRLCRNCQIQEDKRFESERTGPTAGSHGVPCRKSHPEISN